MNPPESESAGGALLRIDDLRLVADRPAGTRPVVDHVTLRLDPGRTLGLVGESGCGKTLTALAAIGLLPRSVRQAGGRVTFDGRDLGAMGAEALRRLRGDQVAMVFQEPMSALNPVLTVGRQLTEPLREHRGLSRAAARRAAVRWLVRVGVPAPEARLRDYPHRLSGGLRQRVMIAAALVCRPRLLLADEPTTALDATLQAQILRLIMDLQSELEMGVMLITHDLAVVAQAADTVAVMYAGQLVETAPAAGLFARPFHPYTRGLLAALPGCGRPGDRLREIPGTVPRHIPTGPGCRFADRCAHVFAPCRREMPALMSTGRRQLARCWLARHPEGRPSDG